MGVRVCVAVPGFKLVSSRHLVSSRSSGVPSQSLTFGGQSSCAVPGLKLVSSRHLVSSIGRQASPVTLTNTWRPKFVFSPRVEAHQQSSSHELHWSSGVPSRSLSWTLGGQSLCAVPGLKLVSSRHLVSSIGRQASPHSHSHEHLEAKVRVQSQGWSSPAFVISWAPLVVGCPLTVTLMNTWRSEFVCSSRVEARQQSSLRERRASPHSHSHGHLEVRVRVPSQGWSSSAVVTSSPLAVGHLLTVTLTNTWRSEFVCSPRVEARQQSSSHELHWSSGVPSRSLSWTLGGQSLCAVPGLKLVSSRHLVSSIGRQASPHSHSHEHLEAKFVFSPRVEAHQHSSSHELHWSSGVPSRSLSWTLGGQSSCAVPGLKLVSSRHFVSVGRPLTVTLTDTWRSEFVFRPRVEAHQQSSPRLHWPSGISSQSLSRTLGGQSSCAVPGLKLVSSYHLMSSISRRASPHGHSHEHLEVRVRVQSQGWSSSAVITSWVPLVVGRPLTVTLTNT